MKKITIFLIIAAIIIAGLYFLGSDSDTPNQPPSNKTTTSTISTDTEQLETTVQAFLMSTLGTLSNGNISLEMAKELTTPRFSQRLSDISAIPMIYGIQQGPDDISIDKPQIIDDTAIIDVDGLWEGEVMQAWTFELALDSANIWKISKITPAN